MARVATPDFLAKQSMGIQRGAAESALRTQADLFPETTGARQNLFEEFMRLSETLPGQGSPGAAGSGTAGDPILAMLTDTIRAEAAQAGGSAGPGGAGGFISKGIRVQGAAEQLRQNRLQELLGLQQNLGQPIPQIRTPDRS